MHAVLESEGRLVVRTDEEHFLLEAWGRDGVRVRCAPAGESFDDDVPQALLARPASQASIASVEENRATLTVGTLTVAVEAWRRSDEDVPMHRLRWYRGSELLLEEVPRHWNIPPHVWSRRSDGYQSLEVTLARSPGERLYGLGQHHHGLLELTGSVTELVQRNSEVVVPVVVSSRGYAFLWNCPAQGRVELATTGTRWVADAVKQLDVWVCDGGDVAGAVDRYTEVTGRVPEAPDWFTGFWQSRLRYASQDEVLAVARRMVAEGFPVSVIVIDFFHWSAMGEYRFDPRAFPDPAAMIDELHSLGIRVAVSLWPTIHPGSDEWTRFADNGWVVTRSDGEWPLHFVDQPDLAETPMTFYDATAPGARRRVAELVARNYLDIGVDVLWVDANEPEIHPERHDLIRYAAGPAAAVGNAYPVLHASDLAGAMRDRGLTPVLLSRSSWAGGSRHGQLVWSGDIASDWETLRSQLPTALSMGLSGFPWWTFDIGGFRGGRPDDESFRELLVRWFELGVFMPVTRLHGLREPGSFRQSAHNEPWSFGPSVEQHIRSLLSLRENLRPTVGRLLSDAAATGAPVVRPIFWHFPDEPDAWTCVDRFLLGPDILVAPVMAPGVSRIEVTLPAGRHWLERGTGPGYAGGDVVEVEAPLGDPVWFRAL
jgi:alpha-D-xyloside xylohydrolase